MSNTNLVFFDERLMLGNYFIYSFICVLDLRVRKDSVNWDPTLTSRAQHVIEWVEWVGTQ